MEAGASARELVRALQRCRIDPSGRLCLDFGQGAGVFTEVLLAARAKQVVGVDVERGLIHPRLLTDSRVSTLNVDVLDFEDSESNPGWSDNPVFDLVVGDLPLPQELVVKSILSTLGPFGDALMLVSSDLEVPHGRRGDDVKWDPHLLALVERQVRKAYEPMLEVRDCFESLSTADGCRKFFVHATRGLEKWR